jgi:hypothetical protein
MQPVSDAQNECQHKGDHTPRWCCDAMHCGHLRHYTVCKLHASLNFCEHGMEVFHGSIRKIWPCENASGGLAATESITDIATPSLRAVPTLKFKRNSIKLKLACEPWRTPSWILQILLSVRLHCFRWLQKLWTSPAKSNSKARRILSQRQTKQLKTLA